MIATQKKYNTVTRLLLLPLLVFSGLISMHSDIVSSSASELDEVGILAGESPGEGYGPELLTDYEGVGGVLSFVAPKGNRCERLVLELTPAAIKDNIKLEIAQYDRVPNNPKWERQKNEHHAFTIWDPAVKSEPEQRPITIEYNHAGHKGVHGGRTAKDTHHNWGIRLKRDGKYLTADNEQWKGYIRIILSSFSPTIENVYHGDRGVGKAYMTLDEADKLVEWNYLTPTGAALIDEINDEVNRLEQNDLDTVSNDVETSLAFYGLTLKKDENGQWLIWGTKNKIKNTTTHQCPRDMSIGGVSDRVMVTLKK